MKQQPKRQSAFRTTTPIVIATIPPRECHVCGTEAEFADGFDANGNPRRDEQRFMNLDGGRQVPRRGYVIDQQPHER